MVRLYSLVSFYLLSLVSFGQGGGTIINTPGFDFSVSPYGLFSSNNPYGAALFYPSNSYKPIFANSGIWLVGILPNGELRSSINLSPTKTDFTFGPLNINKSQTLDSAKWSRTWSLNKEVVSVHRSMLQNNDYQIPQEILDWPANAPDGYVGPLVPFIDWNNSGKYEPEEGDVPVMEGDYTLFALYNDYSSSRINPSDSGLGVELKQFSYVLFNSEENKLILFNRLLLTNRNSFKINSFKIGIYTESLIGIGNNNFIRTIPNLNSIAVYNSTGKDSLYGNKVPSLGIISLNKSVAGTMYISSDNNVVTGLPTNSVEVNNYLTGRWRNGKILSYGSNGIDGSSTTRYIYPGNEDPDNQGFEWTEENSGSVAGYRNMLMRFDSLDFEAGQTIEYRYAYQIIPEANANIQSIRTSIEKTKEQYSNTLNKISLKSSVQVYPNLFSGITSITIKSNSPIEKLVISDLRGKKLKESKFVDTQFQLDLLVDLPSGTYCLQVITKNGVIVKKLISQ